MRRLISTVLIAIMIIGTPVYGQNDVIPTGQIGTPSNLGIWTIDERVQEKREFIGSLYRENRLIWEARSLKYQKMLERYNALAMLLKSGRYLVAPGVKADDLKLIRAVTHEDYELLIQQVLKDYPEKFDELKKTLLADAEIMGLYKELSHYKDTEKPTEQMIFNDLLAKAFELIFIIDESIVIPSRDLIKEEVEFAAKMRDLIKHDEFPDEFFDITSRIDRVFELQKDMNERFYWAASKKVKNKKGPDAGAKRDTAASKVSKDQVKAAQTEVSSGALMKRRAFIGGALALLGGAVIFGGSYLLDNSANVPVQGSEPQPVFVDPTLKDLDITKMTDKEVFDAVGAVLRRQIVEVNDEGRKIILIGHIHHFSPDIQKSLWELLVEINTTGFSSEKKYAEWRKRLSALIGESGPVLSGFKRNLVDIRKYASDPKNNITGIGSEDTEESFQKIKNASRQLSFDMWVKILAEIGIKDPKTTAEDMLLSLYGPVGYMIYTNDPILKKARVIPLEDERIMDSHRPYFLRKFEVHKKVEEYIAAHGLSQKVLLEMDKAFYAYDTRWVSVPDAVMDNILSPVKDHPELCKLIKGYLEISPEGIKVFDARNEKAIKEMTAFKGNMIALYGGAHIGPISEILEKQGFTGQIVRGIPIEEVKTRISAQGKAVRGGEIAVELEYIKNAAGSEAFLAKEDELAAIAGEAGLSASEIKGIIAEAGSDLYGEHAKRIVTFPEIIEGPQKYALGLGTDEYLAYGRGVLNALEGLPALRAEFVFHEALCARLSARLGEDKGHKAARQVQKIMFPENYNEVTVLEGDTNPELTGALTLVLRQIILDGLAEFDPALKEVKESFAELERRVEGDSEINGPLNDVKGSGQRTVDIEVLRLCVPYETFRSAPDAGAVLRRIGAARQGRPFEVVVTGVRDEDADAMSGWNKENIKKALRLPENVHVAVMFEREIIERAERTGLSAADPAERAGIIKNLYLDSLGYEALPDGEYMAIVTDKVPMDLSEGIAKKLRGELEKNVSIQVYTERSEFGEILTLSKILSSWLAELKEGNVSAIRIILPDMITSKEMFKALIEAREAAWRAMVAA